MAKQNINTSIESILQSVKDEESFKSISDNTSKTLSLQFDITSDKIIQDEIHLNRDNRILRNTYTSYLYRAYVIKFCQNSVDKKSYKKKIFNLTIALLVLLTLLLIVCFAVVFALKLDVDKVLAIIIPACTTYFGSIFGILKIITEYVFPKEEEQYVNDMVKTIIENDYKSHMADKNGKSD